MPLRGCNTGLAAFPHVYECSLPGEGIEFNVAPGLANTYATNFHWHASTECLSVVCSRYAGSPRCELGAAERHVGTERNLAREETLGTLATLALRKAVRGCADVSGNYCYPDVTRVFREI